MYRRPWKWSIATALAAAVLIHLSAVAIAFHQESPAIPPTVADSTTIGITSPTSRRLPQIPILLSRPPHRSRHPNSLNLSNLLACSKRNGRPCPSGHPCKRGLQPGELP